MQAMKGFGVNCYHGNDCQQFKDIDTRNPLRGASLFLCILHQNRNIAGMAMAFRMGTITHDTHFRRAWVCGPEGDGRLLRPRLFR